MAKKSFLPTRESTLVLWLLNFAAKLVEHRALFGFSTAEADGMTASSLMFEWIVNTITRIKADSKEFTGYKKLLRRGPKGEPTDQLPAFHLPPAPGVIVPSAIFERVSRYADRIKASDNYTEALGHDFGIIGPDDPFNPDDYKTNISAKVFDQYVDIDWLKGKAETANFYSRNRGEAAWEFIGYTSTSPFRDSRPTATPVVREYMAKGVVKGQEIGLPSNIITVTFGGVAE